ncbi:uncharacterized protein LOC141777537 [Sebastes fasciatus]|uniref:uncharacterized protein LOC141777537 n=1 Tax=Sebastes fasciatus TaxID=394691 RepID=UPI003D9E4A61
MENSFHRFRKWMVRHGVAGEKTGSLCRQDNPGGFNSKSRILDLERAERAKRAALTRHAEKMCTAEKARGDAVLERMGLSTQVTLPSPPPPALPRGYAKSKRRISPLLDVPRVNEEDINTNQRSRESLDEEDEDSFWNKVQVGGQMAALACEADRDRSPSSSISSVSCLSPVDTHTPRELRAICLFKDSFRPTPPPLPPRAVPLSRRRASRLPVSARYSRAIKEVADGCRLAPAPAAPKRTPVAAPKRTPVAITKRTPQAAPERSKVELQPLAKPVESLSVCLEQLSSDDWMNKINGLKTLQALARHHSETLKTRLHEVCLVLIQEVNNLRSAVACAAMNIIAELYVALQKAMDPKVESTGRALLLKFGTTTNAFIHQEANHALDAMVENCSPGRVVTVLLSTALNHRCVAVRGNMAQHLHQLAHSLGAAHILTAGRSFTERFLVAVSKMCLDAAPVVRHYGRLILQELALHKDFLSLWRKIVPENNRTSLDKILKQAKL